MRRRVSPGTAYGLALTAGLVLIGLFSWVFGAVVEDVVAREPLVGVDVEVLRFFHSHGEPLLTSAVTSLNLLSCCHERDATCTTGHAHCRIP